MFPAKIHPRNKLRIFIFNLIFFGALGFTAPILQCTELKINMRPETLSETWSRTEPFMIPFVDKAQAEAAFDRIQAPMEFLSLERFLLHAEAPKILNMLFCRDDGGITESDALSRVKLAHDGETLFLFAEWPAPEGKKQGDGEAYGTWPERTGEHAGPLPEPLDNMQLRTASEDSEANFDNTEFMVVSLDNGRSQEVAALQFLIDVSGKIIGLDYSIFNELSYKGREAAIRYSGNRGREYDESGLLAKTGSSGNLRLAAVKIPIIQLIPEASDTDGSTFSMNIGLVAGAPGDGIPMRSVSIAGSFLGHSIFPRFVLGDSAKSLTAAGLCYGKTTASKEYPRGKHTAYIAIFSANEAEYTNIQHKLEVNGEEINCLDRIFFLHKGRNLISWEWELREDWDEFTHRLYAGGKEVDASYGRPTPRVFFSPLQHALSADGYLRFNVDMGYLPEALSDYKLNLSLYPEDGGKERRWEIEKLEKACLEGSIDLKKISLEPGTFVLAASISLPGGHQLDRSESKINIMSPKANLSSSFLIPVVPVSGAVSAGMDWPARVGIPFPAGTLSETEDMELIDSGGRSIAFSAREAARWAGDNSLKWVHLDFSFKPGEKYWVRRTRYKSPGPALENPVIIKEDDDSITVDTGAIAFLVGREGFSGFHSVTLGISEETFRKEYPVQKGGFYVMGEGGVRFDSRHSPGKTVIEYSSPHRVTLKFSGSCVSEDGIEALRYILRITAYAGQPMLEFMPTFIVTANTRITRFLEIGMITGLAGEANVIRHGNKTFISREGLIRIRQTSPDMRQAMVRNGIWEYIDDDAPARFRAKSAEGETGIAVRDFQNKSPLEIKHIAGSGLTLSLWPDMSDYQLEQPGKKLTDADLPRLPFAHSGPFLDFNVPPAYLNANAKIWGNTKNFYFPNGIVLANAMGVARTHEFLVTFSAEDEGKSTALEENYLQNPVFSVSPEWMARTGAVSGLPMSERKAFEPESIVGRTEIAMERMFDWEMRNLGPVSPGKWTWGAAHSWYDVPSKSWLPWRLFRNTHHGGTKGYWYQFARTGDAKYLEFASRATEYLADIALCNYSDTDLAALRYYGKHFGAVCDYKGYVPWNSGSRFDYNTYSEYFLIWYYITGHPRASDAIDAMHKYLLYGAPHGLYGRRSDAGRYRSGDSRLESACSLYSHTFDGRLIRYLHASFEIPKSYQTETGYIPRRTGFGTWLQYYINLTENPDAIEVLRRWAYVDVNLPWFGELWAGGGWMLHWWDIQGYAYSRFRDPELLSVSLARLEREMADAVILNPASALDGYRHAIDEWRTFGPQKIPSVLWAIEEADEAVTPAPLRDTLGFAGSITSPEFDQRGSLRRVSTFNSGPEWSTWCVFATDPGASSEGNISLRFAGHGNPGEIATFRILSSGGMVAHQKSMPDFEWEYGAGGPIVQLEIDLRGMPGPYWLQVKSKSDLVFGPMLPFTSCPKEVYPTGPDRRIGFRRGKRRLTFYVPENGEDTAVSAISKGGYHIRLRDANTGEVLISRSGYATQRGLGTFIKIPADELKVFSGGPAVMDTVQEERYMVFEHGESIPGFVSLGAEAFFLPPPPPAVD